MTFSLGAVNCHAAEITSLQAKAAVSNWLIRDAVPLGEKLGGTARDTVTYKNAGGDPLFHVVSLEEGGFVVTSADDGIRPVIAFSDGNSLVADEGNPLWVLLNQDLSQRLDALTASRVTSSSKSISGASAGQSVQNTPEAEWADLLDDRPIRALALTSLSDVRIAPLVQSHWGQSTVAGFWSSYPCYNYYTPNEYPCGCVATAMAQIMRYHCYPATSVSARTVDCQVNDVPTSLTMKGGRYSWSNMTLLPDEGSDTAPSETVRKAIGKLCYDAGVSVGMMYASDGSGALSTDVPDALVDVFDYASACLCRVNWRVTEDDIQNAILANLDHSYPVYLSISGDSGNHAVVADGYGYNRSVRYIHLNMGWNINGNGGYQNAWYNVPNVDSVLSFSVLDSIVYNVFPETDKKLVSGRVLSASGTPVADATVSIRDLATGEIRPTLKTNTKGIYTFSWNGSNSREDSAAVSAANGAYKSAETIVTAKLSTDSSVGNVWGVDLYLSEPSSYTVTFDAQNGIIPSPATKTVTYGSTYGILATAVRTGHTFAGWWTEPNGTGTQVTSATTVAITTAQTLYAKWTTNRYTLSVSSAHGGVWPEAETNVLYGTTINATVANSPVVNGTTQYVCKGWSGTGCVPQSGTATDIASFTVTTNAAIEWVWETNYWVHADTPENGRMNTSDQWLPSGTNIQVTATPDPYYIFDSWQGETTGCPISSNRITLIINSPRSIHALFTEDMATNAVPKWWLAQYGLHHFEEDALSDVDSDGLNTWQEYVAGTNPTNQDSCLRVTERSQNVIGWNTVSGRVYSVYWTTNLLTGLQCVESNIPWTENCFTNSLTAPGGYYTITVQQE